MQATDVTKTEEGKCLICGFALGGSITICETCDTPHCQDCWKYNQMCAVYGCGKTDNIQHITFHPTVIKSVVREAGAIICSSIVGILGFFIGRSIRGIIAFHIVMVILFFAGGTLSNISVIISLLTVLSCWGYLVADLIQR